MLELTQGTLSIFKIEKTSFWSEPKSDSFMIYVLKRVQPILMRPGAVLTLTAEATELIRELSELLHSLFIP